VRASLREDHRVISALPSPDVVLVGNDLPSFDEPGARPL
jgi:hypothetical protein